MASMNEDDSVDNDENLDLTSTHSTVTVGYVPTHAALCFVVIEYVSLRVKRFGLARCRFTKRWRMAIENSTHS